MRTTVSRRRQAGRQAGWRAIWGRLLMESVLGQVVGRLQRTERDTNEVFKFSAGTSFDKLSLELSTPSFQRSC